MVSPKDPNIPELHLSEDVQVKNWEMTTQTPGLGKATFMLTWTHAANPRKTAISDLDAGDSSLPDPDLDTRIQKLNRFPLGLNLSISEENVCHYREGYAEDLEFKSVWAWTETSLEHLTPHRHKVKLEHY
jgi:hypothetical protein